MTDRFYINDLWQIFDEADFLITGSPKGVGFTTFITEWAAENMFLKEDYSILILTKDRKTQIDIIFKILENYKYYHENGVERDGNILYSLKKKLSVTGVFCYDEININEIYDFYDCIIIDSDDYSERLYKSIDHMMGITSKLIFNTYDVPQSIFYNYPDAPKIILTSEHNKKLKKKLSNSYSEIVNFDRILDGKFEEY